MTKLVEHMSAYVKVDSGATITHVYIGHHIKNLDLSLVQMNLAIDDDAQMPFPP
jgi:hypothetical protein